MRARRSIEVIIGTVGGDIHDIGKDLVVFMLDVNGFEVLGLGIDVPVRKFVDTIKETDSEVVGLSGFPALAFYSMKETVDAVKQSGLRDEIKIMIGGCLIDDDLWVCTSVNTYVKGAMGAVSLSEERI